MLRSLLKLALVGVLLFAAYRAASTYYLFRLMDHFAACYPQSGMCSLAEQNAPAARVEQAAQEAMSCVSRRQGTLEAFFHPAQPPAGLAITPAAGGLAPESRHQILEMCKTLVHIDQRNQHRD